MFSCGLSQPGVGDVVTDVLVDGAEGLAESGWCLGLVGGHQGAKQPVVQLGVRVNLIQVNGLES